MKRVSSPWRHRTGSEAMNARGGRLPGAAKRRALGAVLAAALSGCVFTAGCESDPNTIRLLDSPDGGTGCGQDSDCNPNLPYCDVPTHRCVECLSAAACSAGLSCSTATHSCTTHCASADDCAGIERTLCGATGTCVQCESDTDCTDTPQLPRCNVQAGVCVECTTNTDCSPALCFDDCLKCSSFKCVWRT